jgi:hypothetical protein
MPVQTVLGSFPTTAFTTAILGAANKTELDIKFMDRYRPNWYLLGILEVECRGLHVEE